MQRDASEEIGNALFGIDADSGANGPFLVADC
jgi:hypothetical protein